MSDRKKNLISINVARGLAAFSVFVYHYNVGYVLAKYTGVEAFNWLALPGALFGVTLFFVISGFCIHGSEWRRLQIKTEAKFCLRDYIIRRVRRIYPVYMLALIVAWLLNGFMSEWPTFSDITLHVLLLHGFSAEHFNTINLVLWTISVEAFFYIIYPIWLNYRLNVGLKRAFVAGTLISLTSLLVTALFFYPFGYPSRWFFINTWGGWLFGALLAETVNRNAGFFRSFHWWSLGLFLWILYLITEWYDLYQGRWLVLLFPVRIYLCGWPLTALLLAEGKLTALDGINAKVVQFFSMVGLSSYSVYLLHCPLIQVRTLLQEIIPLGHTKLPFQIGWFFVTIIICWFSYRFIELRFMSPSKTRGCN